MRFKHQKELFIAAEGMYSGQFLYAGKKATLTIGNIKPIGEMPEGTIICNVEEVRCWWLLHCMYMFSDAMPYLRMRYRDCDGIYKCRHELMCRLWSTVQKAGDRGSLARASGDYCIVVAHNPETGVTRIKLPSGSKKVRNSELISWPYVP